MIIITIFSSYHLGFVSSASSRRMQSVQDDDLWPVFRHVLKKIYGECHRRGRRQRRAAHKTVNGAIPLTGNLGTTPDGRVVTVSGVVPTPLTVNPSISRRFVEREEATYRDQQRYQDALQKRVEAIPDEADGEPVLHLVLDLDHTLAHTVEVNDQVSR